MGAVLAATRMGHYLTVALKVMLAEEAKNEDSTKRFFRHALVASAIHSPHLARLLDLGRLENRIHRRRDLDYVAVATQLVEERPKV